MTFLNMFKKTILIIAVILVFLGSTELVLRLSGWKETSRLYEEIDDPDIGWVHLAGFAGDHRQRTRLKINSQGLREDREYTFDKPQDTFRIFAVGECLIVGDSVAVNDSFPKQLEAMLNKGKPFAGYKNYEVINGGHTQYDELQKVNFLKKYGLKYHPDLIIFSHDISPKPWIEARASLRPVRLMLKKIPKQIYSIRYLTFNIENIIESAWNRFFVEEGLSYSDPKKWAVSRYTGKGLENSKIVPALKELSRLSREEHIPVIVLFTPWLDHLDEGVYPFKEAHQFYGRECAKNHLALLDLYDYYFRNKQASLFWVGDNNRRPNALGHRMIAEIFYRQLIKLSPRAARDNNQ